MLNLVQHLLKCYVDPDPEYSPRVLGGARRDGMTYITELMDSLHRNQVSEHRKYTGTWPAADLTEPW